LTRRTVTFESGDRAEMCANDVLFACRQPQRAGAAPGVDGQKRQTQSIFRHSVCWRFTTFTTFTPATAAETETETSLSV